MPFSSRLGKLVEDKTQVRVVAVVRAGRQAAVGRTRGRLGGNTETVTQKNDRATVQLGEFAKPGKRTVKVIYIGDINTARAVGSAASRVQHE